MKVKDAIEWLQGYINIYGEDTELIVAWWDAEAFGMEQDSEEWLQMVEILDNKMDYHRYGDRYLSRCHASLCAAFPALGLPRTSNSLGFDFILSFPYSGRVYNLDWQAIQLDVLMQQIAGCARNILHNRRPPACQPIEEG